MNGGIISCKSYNGVLTYIYIPDPTNINDYKEVTHTLSSANISNTFDHAGSPAIYVNEAAGIFVINPGRLGSYLGGGSYRTRHSPCIGTF
jgi:hypothetical protein